MRAHTHTHMHVHTHYTHHTHHTTHTHTNMHLPMYISTIMHKHKQSNTLPCIHVTHVYVQMYTNTHTHTTHRLPSEFAAFVGLDSMLQMLQ